MSSDNCSRSCDWDGWSCDLNGRSCDMDGRSCDWDGSGSVRPSSLVTAIFIEKRVKGACKTHSMHCKTNQAVLANPWHPQLGHCTKPFAAGGGQWVPTDREEWDGEYPPYCLVPGALTNSEETSIQHSSQICTKHHSQIPPSFWGEPGNEAKWLHTLTVADTKINTLALFHSLHMLRQKVSSYPASIPRLLPEAGYEANKKVGGDVGIMLFTDTLCSGGTQSHTLSLHVYSTLTREGLCRNSSAGKSWKRTSCMNSQDFFRPSTPAPWRRLDYTERLMESKCSRDQSYALPVCCGKDVSIILRKSQPRKRFP